MGEQAAIRRMCMRGLASLLHGSSSVALASFWDSKGQSGRPSRGGFQCLSVSAVSWGRRKPSDRPEKEGRKEV